MKDTNRFLPEYSMNKLSREPGTFFTSEVISELSTDEKAMLLEGYRSWYTNGIERLRIPSLCLVDGPHGVRKVREADGGFDIADNEISSSFPTSVTVASTWNPALAEKMGAAIAREAKHHGVHVILAPGINIKRSPLCGRNFEYFSEDPLISGIFGEAFVRGVQGEGVGCCVKHFAANSNEDYRFIGDSIIDPRALREIYLRAFEKIVKNASPAAIMCSYNKLNGIFASENRKLLTDILRTEWGYKGVVMTDWGATNDRLESVLAGCDLDMPGNVQFNRKALIAGAGRSRFIKAAIDSSAARVLDMISRLSAPEQKKEAFNWKEHARIGRDIAAEGAVLLKNTGALPLSRNGKMMVIGEMFEKMRYQGAGSSLINPPEVISPIDSFKNRGIDFVYKEGYHSLDPRRNIMLEKNALAAVNDAGGDDTILFFGGLSDLEESEGFDRKHMRMGDNQIELLNQIVKTGRPVVLVLFTGSPVEIPCIDKLSAVLNMNLPGMHGGEALADLLFGDVSPSGKLTESWPLRIEDSSCYADYNRSAQARYYESIYTGYRFYDKAGVKLQFPFGYGLSYTNFEYSAMEASESDGEVQISAKIKNIGKTEGSEIVQLYVRNAESTVFKSEKELRGFTKVFLKPGESRTVDLRFDKQELSYWNVDENRWVLENGVYELCLASSAADIRLTQPMEISDAEDLPSPYNKVVTADYQLPPRLIPASFSELVGSHINDEPDLKPLTINSMLKDFQKSFFGRIFYNAVIHTVNKDYKKALSMPDSLERDARIKNSYFIVRMMPRQSIRSMTMASGGGFKYHIALGVVELANGHLFRALKHFLGKDEVCK